MLYTIPPTKHFGNVKLNPMINNQIDVVTGEYYTIEDKKEIKVPFKYELNPNYKSPYELPDNEFLSCNTTIDFEGKIVPIYEHLSKQILKEYGKGKQTIEATIMMSDYKCYGENKNNVNNIEKHTVYNYIPDVGDSHIYLDENLKPYSYYYDGKPKEFCVTSVTMEYSIDNGISFNIKAQEISKTILQTK